MNVLNFYEDILCVGTYVFMNTSAPFYFSIRRLSSDFNGSLQDDVEVLIMVPSI